MGEAVRNLTDVDYTGIYTGADFGHSQWVEDSAAFYGPGTYFFDVPIGRQVVRVEGSDSNLPEQLDDVLDSFDRMSLLQRGWDSYGAEPIRSAAIIEAFSLILTDRRYELSPDLAPTRGGGVQIEWEHQGREFDVRVEGPGEYYAYFLDATGEEWDPGRRVAMDEIEHYFGKLKSQ